MSKLTKITISDIKTAIVGDKDGNPIFELDPKSFELPFTFSLNLEDDNYNAFKENEGKETHIGFKLDEKYYAFKCFLKEISSIDS